MTDAEAVVMMMVMHELTGRIRVCRLTDQRESCSDQVRYEGRKR